MNLPSASGSYSIYFQAVICKWQFPWRTTAERKPHVLLRLLLLPVPSSRNKTVRLLPLEDKRLDYLTTSLSEESRDLSVPELPTIVMGRLGVYSMTVNLET